MLLLITTLISAVFAGLVAVLVTVAIEKLGGTLGGVLATVPSTIVPASIAMAYRANSWDDIADAMFSVPVGMLINSLFLWTWRVVPDK
jgi:hypothetical protein